MVIKGLQKKNMPMKQAEMFSNRAMAALFVPLVIEQALSYSVELIDSMMVASLGEAAVSGVALVSFIMTLLISLFSALATGGAVVTGQAIGKKEKDSAVKSANQLMKVSLLIGLAVGALLLWGREGIFQVLYSQIEADVRRAALTYFGVVTLSIPFLALYNSLAALYRVMGDSGLPMKVMFWMNVLNLAGNALLVYGIHLGVFGIALSTLISRIGAALILFLLLRDHNRDIYIWIIRLPVNLNGTR